MKGDGFVFTRKMGGAAVCGWKIRSTTISNDNVTLDCLSNSCARCFCTGVVLYDLENLCLDQLCSWSAL